MNEHSMNRKIEKKIRKTYAYSEWVKRNKSFNCIVCASEEKLHLHHVTDLSSMIYNTYKTFNWMSEVWEEVYDIILQLHENDMCHCITVCEQCHGNIHPTKKKYDRKETELIIDEWCIIPRNYNFTFCQRGRKQGEVGYIALQTLFGIGWHLYQGNFENRKLEFGKYAFGQLLGKKKNSSQFNTSLQLALEDLSDLGIVEEFNINNKKSHLIISKEYITRIDKMPWFIRLSDVATSKSNSVLTLKTWLAFQSSRIYKIRIERLAKHLNYNSTRATVVRNVKSSVEQISWLSLEVKDGMFHFTHQRKGGAVPVHTQRLQLNKVILRN
jgi:hypothetical protein